MHACAQAACRQLASWLASIVVVSAKVVVSMIVVVVVSVNVVVVSVGVVVVSLTDASQSAASAARDVTRLSELLIASTIYRCSIKSRLSLRLPSAPCSRLHQILTHSITNAS